MFAWKKMLLCAVVAVACSTGLLAPGCASAEDMWVYRGYDDVDYFLKDETIRIDGDDWLADVEVVDHGVTKFVATFRFRMTGRWVDDIEERAVAMWWKSKKKWIDMGISSKDPLAHALWEGGVMPYVAGDDSTEDASGDDVIAEKNKKPSEAAKASQETKENDGK